jgi:hypothetical protein
MKVESQKPRKSTLKSEKPPIEDTQEKSPENSSAVKSEEPYIYQITRLIFSDKAILAIVLGAIGYFFGWRFLFSYYGGFGLDPAFFSFSPIDVISAGWRIYVFVAGVILGAVTTLQIGKTIVQYQLALNRVKPVLVFFALFLLIGVLFGLYLLYRFFFIMGAHSTLEFYLVAAVTLICIWISYVIGETVYTYLQKPRAIGSSFFFWLYKLVFPNPFIWFMGVAILFIGITAYFSSYVGALNNNRDKAEGSRLQLVEVYSSTELDIPNGQLIRPGTWLYEDLRFVYKTEDIYFVFRLAEVQDGIVTLYAIPRSAVLQLTLRSWFYKLLHP